MIYDSLALFGMLFVAPIGPFGVSPAAGGASSTPLVVVANFKSKQKIANSFVADHSSKKT